MGVAGKKSVLVLDRATFHTALGDDGIRPVTSWNKALLCSAIGRRGGAPDDWILTWKKRISKANSKAEHELGILRQSIRYKK